MTSRPILLLRSGLLDPGEEGDRLPEGVDLLVTHRIVADPGGVQEALSFRAEGALLVLTSRTTVKVLADADPNFFRQSFEAAVVAGEATGEASRVHGAACVVVPELPGAAGVAQEIAKRDELDVLWPHGADADPAPFTAVARGRRWTSPTVYEKKPVESLDPNLVGRLLEGSYSGVAVSSLAALDVLLAAVRAAGRPLPQVRWGAIGPGTAQAFAKRNLPEPVVPAQARLADLIESVQETLPEETSR